MGNLGDKEYNEAYYLAPTGRFSGNPGEPGFMALTPKNIWSYYYNQPDRTGKPLDESIALFRIPGTCSYACNSTLTIEKNLSSLTVNRQTCEHESSVPLAMMLADCTSDGYSGFETDPRERLAYDTSNVANYVYSPLIYDIDNTCFCVYMGVLSLNENTGSQSGKTLSQIGSMSEHEFITMLRPYIYGGTNTSRIRYQDPTSRVWIPPENEGWTAYQGFPVIDTLTDRPIPANSYIRDWINYENADWNTEFTYSPFAISLNMGNDGGFFSTEVYTIQDQHDIGYSFTQTVNQIQTGRNVIPNTTYGVSMRYYRCNYSVQDFDDVSYKWSDRIYDATAHEWINEGTDISSLPSGRYLRFCTVLEIVDPKGHTRGEALQLAVLHEYAFLGFYFTGTISAAETAELGSEASSADLSKLYLPIFENGTTTGLYVTGEDIRTAPNADSHSMSDDVYHFTATEDEGDLTSRYYSTEMKDSTRLFALTQTDFSQLCVWLNSTLQNDIVDSDDYLKKFKNTNPADYVISIRYYPFDLPKAYALDMYIGPVNVSSSIGQKDFVPRRIGPKRAEDLGGQSLWNFGTVELSMLDNDFRLNYTKMLLYIPWCGYSEIDPKIFAYSSGGVPSKLNVKMSIDYVTGSCMGIVTRINPRGDETVIQTLNGSCGVEVPLFAINQGDYNKTIHDLEVALQQAENNRFTAGVALAGSIIGTAASAFSGNAMGTVAGAGGMMGAAATLENTGSKIDSIQYQIEHYYPSVSAISGASPFNNVIFEALPKLYIYKPLMLPGYDRTAYGKTVGFACNKNGKLSDFSGLTVCAAFDLSGIECTAEEKQIIANYLKGGVIV